MIDFSNFCCAIGIFLGFCMGIIMSIILACSGHGWMSMIAIPLTPIVMGILGYIMDLFA